MIITIFAKKRQTKEGKTFYNYLTTLTDREGMEYPAQVRFREECGNPRVDQCPMNIEFDKCNANLTRRQYTHEETGEIRTTWVLWVSKWHEGLEYVDTSLDEFD